MDNGSLQFVAFGLIVALISNLRRSRIWRSAVLLLASLVFFYYLDKDPISLLPMAGFLLLGFACMRLLQRINGNGLGWILALVIFVYIWLKKYTFLPEAMFIDRPYLVLGLSYIFFRVLHLLIEAPGRERTSRIGFFSYILYTVNFTTFISGPIQLYDEFARDQFAEEPISLDSGTVGLQLERIIRGMFKVNVLAMLLNMCRVDAIARMAGPWPASVKIAAALELSLAYPLFLYANFSGYIDIVIALARLMRLRLPENFDRPFSATCVLDFWNQWHITLSNWLKRYVFNPLLVFLMRQFPSPGLDPFLGVICFFITFFLIGIWHGRTSEFIVFGILTGGGMSLNKLWQIALTRSLGRKQYKAIASNRVYEAFGRGLNFVWFAFTLFWFWGSWNQINSVFRSLNATRWIICIAVAWLGATTVLALWELLRMALLSLKTENGPVLVNRYARVVYASVLGLVVFVFTILLNQAAPEIVYRAF